MVHLQNQQSDFETGNVQPVIVVMATPNKTRPVVEVATAYPVLWRRDQVAYRSFEIPKR